MQMGHGCQSFRGTAGRGLRCDRTCMASGPHACLPACSPSVCALAELSFHVYNLSTPKGSGGEHPTECLLTGAHTSQPSAGQ